MRHVTANRRLQLYSCIALLLRPSVRLSHRIATVAGGFAAERPARAGDIDRWQAPAFTSNGAKHSDPSGPVNSCKFLYFCSCPVLSCISFVVLYFPVFLFVTVLGCVYSFTLEVQRVFSVKRYLHQLVSVDCS